MARALLLGVASPVIAVAAGPDVTFPGGSLDDLRESSPTLEFGRLVITGALVIDLNNDAGAADVRMLVDELEIAPGGRIGRRQSACSYEDSPDLRILAGGSVVLDGEINLQGKSGDRENEFTTCNRCRGRDGGDVLIRGRDIRLADAIGSNGGFGSSDEFQVDGTTFRNGCNGGDSGRIRLEAASRIALGSGAGFFYRGGGGGSGNSNGSDGSDGAAGSLDLVAPDITGAESEPNGSQARAHDLLLAPLELTGYVDEADDAGETNPVFVTFEDPGVPPDRLEDLFEIEVLDHGLALVQLEAQNASTDIDIYLIESENGNVVAVSNAPAGAIERFQYAVAPGTYYLGVSWCCDTPGSNYTLRLGPIDLVPVVPPTGLSEVDLFSSGDALATLDAATELLWLDVTATVNRSYDAIAAGVGGWAAAGFRPATAAEVCGLLSRYASAPSPCPGPFASTVSGDLVTQLQQLLGITLLTGTGTTTRATFDDGGGNMVGVALFGFDDGSSTVAVASELMSASQADVRLGHFLVQPVPEPSAGWLAAAALAALAACRSRGWSTSRGHSSRARSRTCLDRPLGVAKR